MNDRTSAPFFEQETRRQRNLVTPVYFSVALGTTATTIYAGRADEFFLIRKLMIANTTAGSLNLSLLGGGDTWVSSEPIAANTTIAEDGFEGLLMNTGEDLEGTGSAAGLRAVGWGLRVLGGDGWTL